VSGTRRHRAEPALALEAQRAAMRMRSFGLGWVAEEVLGEGHEAAETLD
jgi:hypothetical protein